MSVRKKVILKDIAEQLDVSVVTVSNALAGRRGVGQEMRKKIIDLAGEMGYESAYNMSGNDRTIRIGVFTPQKARFELSPVFLALGKQELRRNRLNEKLVFLPIPRINRGYDGFQDDQFDGYIVFGAKSQALLDYICTKARVPVLSFGRINESDRTDSVVMDCFHGMFHVISNLIGMGHRRICLIGATSQYGLDQEMGYYKAFDAAGLVPPEDMTYRNFIIGNISPQKNQEVCERLEILIRELMSREIRPTAFACGSDTVAEETIRILNSMNIRVPQDVSVTGFFRIDDEEDPGVTSLTWPIQLMAKEALNVLRRRMEGEKDACGVISVQGKWNPGNSAASITQEPESGA